MAEVDRNCLLQQHPEYLSLVRPESMRQRTAIGFCQDIGMYSLQPWSFSPADLPSSTTRNVHLWHGTNDQQVGTELLGLPAQWPSACNVMLAYRRRARLQAQSTADLGVHRCQQRSPGHTSA